MFFGFRPQKGADLVAAEKHLLNDERVESVATFVGQGPPRFYLPVDPEYPYASYAQLIVNVHDFRQIDDLIADLGPWFRRQFPQAEVPLRKYGVGPSNTWKFELRYSGPAVADPGVLRRLATQGRLWPRQEADYMMRKDGRKNLGRWESHRSHMSLFMAVASPIQPASGGC